MGPYIININDPALLRPANGRPGVPSRGAVKKYDWLPHPGQVRFITCRQAGNISAVLFIAHLLCSWPRRELEL